MIAMGVDPGLKKTGYALVECSEATTKFTLVEHGLISTSIEESDGYRLVEIHNTLRNLCEKHSPERVAVEQVYPDQNTTSQLTEKLQVVATVHMAAARITKVMVLPRSEVWRLLTDNKKTLKKPPKKEIRRMASENIDTPHAEKPLASEEEDAIACACAALKSDSSDSPIESIKKTFRTIIKR